MTGNIYLETQEALRVMRVAERDGRPWTASEIARQLCRFIKLDALRCDLTEQEWMREWWFGTYEDQPRSRVEYVTRLGIELSKALEREGQVVN